MIHTELNNDIKILRIEYGKANPIDITLLDEMLAATSEIPVGGLIITGTGRFFSAGLNLPVLVNYSRDEMRELMYKFHTFQARLLSAPAPVIAAINGHCIAGGYIIAMNCDRRIAIPGEYLIGLNEMAMGIDLPPIATDRITQLWNGSPPPSIVKNEIVNPDLAFKQGIVDELVPIDNLIEQCMKVIREFDPHLKQTNNARLLDRLSQDFDILYTEFFKTWYSPAAQKHISVLSQRLKGR